MQYSNEYKSSIRIKYKMIIIIEHNLTYVKKYAIFKAKGDDVMTSISITKARANLYKTVSDVNEYSEPITITNNRGGKNAVLVSENNSFKKPPPYNNNKFEVEE